MKKQFLILISIFSFLGMNLLQIADAQFGKEKSMLSIIGEVEKQKMELGPSKEEWLEHLKEIGETKEMTNIIMTGKDIMGADKELGLKIAYDPVSYTLPSKELTGDVGLYIGTEGTLGPTSTIIPKTTKGIKNTTKLWEEETNKEGFYIEYDLVEEASNINSSKEEEMISIYPNPVKDYLIVKLDESRFNSVELFIYNSFGEIAKQRKSLSALIEFDLSDLGPGVYFVKISFENKSIIKKLIKE